MSSLADTIKRLASQRAELSRDPGPSRLADLEGFGSNPGTLAAKIYVPAGAAEESPLVVVLHGCTQSAESYDRGSGWSRLADEYGFILLFPEQRRQNNASLCFNWFEPGDIRRGSGEALSISQMIDAVSQKHQVDRKRIFITGLSAGGAMANVMLASYPDVFAGGAVIGGLAYGIAYNIPEALERMRGSDLPPVAVLAEKLAGASRHNGPWPSVSIWHGTRGHTVAETNAHALAEQWASIHETVSALSKSSSANGVHRITQWQTDDGFVSLALHTIKDMGHGTPIDGKSGIGIAAPFILDVGVSSTAEIARSWGLTPSFGRKDQFEPDQGDTLPQRPEPPPADGIQGIIENALRSAGLMR